MDYIKRGKHLVLTVGFISLTRMFENTVISLKPTLAECNKLHLQSVK
jgi:hypothetical protein